MTNFVLLGLTPFRHANAINLHISTMPYEYRDTKTGDVGCKETLGEWVRGLLQNFKTLFLLTGGTSTLTFKILNCGEGPCLDEIQKRKRTSVSFSVFFSYAVYGEVRAKL